MPNEVKTWNHARKGKIVGRVIEDDGEWMVIRLAGDQRLGYVSRGAGDMEDDEEITVRKSLLTEVE